MSTALNTTLPTACRASHSMYTAGFFLIRKSSFLIWVWPPLMRNDQFRIWGGLSPMRNSSSLIRVWLPLIRNSQFRIWGGLPPMRNSSLLIRVWLPLMRNSQFLIGVLTSVVRKNPVDQRILAILARGARYVRQNLPGENGDSK